MRGKWLATVPGSTSFSHDNMEQQKAVEQRRDETTTGCWESPSRVPVVDRKDRWAGDQGRIPRGQCCKEILGNVGKGIQLAGQRGTYCRDDKRRGLEEVALKDTNLGGEGEQSWLGGIGF